MSAPEVHICIPTLRRYDLLRRLLLSLPASTVQPTTIEIIDNGLNYNAVMGAIHWTVDCEINLKSPPEPASVAECWNWFAHHVPEERIICNDDIIFGPFSIAQLIATPGDLVLGYGFSCFLYRDSCMEKLGPFDEALSPGYAYFEDSDYQERAYRALGTPNEIVMVNAPHTGLIHGDGKDGSQTYRAGTEEEQREHWRRYTLAEQNFVKKWGATTSELEARRVYPRPSR